MGGRVTCQPGEPHLVDHPAYWKQKWCVHCSCGKFSVWDDSPEAVKHAARKHAEGVPRKVTHELRGPWWYFNNMWRASCGMGCFYMTDFCHTSEEAEQLVREHIAFAIKEGTC